MGLAVDAELFRLDGLARWLDSVDETLDRLPRRPSTLEPRSVSGADRLPAGAAMTVLELRGVSKRYGEGTAAVQALVEVDLVVEAGALVAVMGPSGSGKSTLLTHHTLKVPGV